MSNQTKKALFSAFIIFIVLLIDQVSKYLVKANLYLGEELYIFSWFRIHFLENEGMAFGMSFFDKKYLTLFRIVASGLLLWYLIHCIKKNESLLLLSCLALIFAGAFGNIIDCIFYGQIYGYTPIFYGKVVDMLYFPLIEGRFWSWIPYFGGESFIFFSPVFNIADSAICIGVALLLIFERRIFK